MANERREKEAEGNSNESHTEEGSESGELTPFDRLVRDTFYDVVLHVFNMVSKAIWSDDENDDFNVSKKYLFHLLFLFIYLFIY